METTFFLAQFWGWFLVILCLIVFLRKDFLIEELFHQIEDRSFSLLSGFVSLVIGLVTIILHNVWTTDWRVVITVFAWLALLKGIVRIGFPEVIQKIMPAYKNNPLLLQVLLVACILIGMWLLWMSYTL